MPQVQWQCQKARRNFEKSLYGASANATAAEKAAAAKLRRVVEIRAAEQRTAVLKKRARALLARQLGVRLRARMAAEKASRKARSEQEAAHQAALDDLPKEFNAMNTGPKGGYGKTGLQMRLLALERLHLCSPPPGGLRGALAGFLRLVRKRCGQDACPPHVLWLGVHALPYSGGAGLGRPLERPCVRFGFGPRLGFGLRHGFGLRRGCGLRLGFGLCLGFGQEGGRPSVFRPLVGETLEADAGERRPVGDVIGARSP